MPTYLLVKSKLGVDLCFVAFCDITELKFEAVSGRSFSACLDSAGWPVIQGISSHESCWTHTEATEILKLRLWHKGPRITSSRPLFIITSCQWNAAHALPLPFPSPTMSCLSPIETQQRFHRVSDREPWLPKDIMTTHCKPGSWAPFCSTQAIQELAFLFPNSRGISQ